MDTRVKKNNFSNEVFFEGTVSILLSEYLCVLWGSILYDKFVYEPLCHFERENLMFVD